MSSSSEMRVLKEIVQWKRRKDAVATNPDLALACDRSLLLHIPTTLLARWKIFDSGQSITLINILTITESILDFLCQSVMYSTEGTAPQLFTQLHIIHRQRKG